MILDSNEFGACIVCLQQTKQASAVKVEMSSVKTCFVAAGCNFLLPVSRHVYATSHDLNLLLIVPGSPLLPFPF